MTPFYVFYWRRKMDIVSTAARNLRFLKARFVLCSCDERVKDIQGEAKKIFI
jgi:hypothetical protein